MRIPFIEYVIISICNLSHPIIVNFGVEIRWDFILIISPIAIACIISRNHNKRSKYLLSSGSIVYQSEIFTGNLEFWLSYTFTINLINQKFSNSQIYSFYLETWFLQFKYPYDIIDPLFVHEISDQNKVCANFRFHRVGTLHF